MGKKKYVIIRKQDKCESTPTVTIDYTEEHCTPHYNRCDLCGNVDPLFAYNNSYRNSCVNHCPPVCNPCAPTCYVTGPSGGTTVVTASPIGGDGSVSDPVTLLPPTVTDGSSLWMWSPISSSYVSVENLSPYLAIVNSKMRMAIDYAKYDKVIAELITKHMTAYRK